MASRDLDVFLAQLNEEYGDLTPQEELPLDLDSPRQEAIDQATQHLGRLAFRPAAVLFHGVEEETRTEEGLQIVEAQIVAIRGLLASFGCQDAGKFEGVTHIAFTEDDGSNRKISYYFRDIGRGKFRGVSFQALEKWMYVRPSEDSSVILGREVQVLACDRETERADLLSMGVPGNTAGRLLLFSQRVDSAEAA